MSTSLQDRPLADSTVSDSVAGDMAPFALRFGIDTPISLRGLLHLDALLGSFAAARGRAFNDIPLRKTIVAGGAPFWNASAAILETGPFGPVNDVVRRVKSLNDRHIDEGFLQSTGFSRSISEMSPHRNLISDYNTHAGVMGVWFTGVGDIDKVMDLLGACQSLGAMHTVGYGRVVSIERYTIDESRLTQPVGVRLESGIPARVIALQTWKRMFNDLPEDASIAVQRAEAPYWSGNRQDCIAPFQSSLMGTRTEIGRLLGIVI